MIFLVVGDNQESRISQIQKIMEPLSGSDVLVYDDTYGTVLDLEHYVYPSLFMSAPPVVHLKFMIGSDGETITASFLKKLLASPTVFLFEEMALSPAVITMFKKSGVVVHEDKKSIGVKKDGDIFAVTHALTAPDKKARWIAYRSTLKTHAIEAVMGILYWKVRDLATKNPKEKNKYNELYKKLLQAHASAWETGASLEVLIEKIILTQ